MTVRFPNEFDAVLRAALLDAQRLDWTPVLEGADPAPALSPWYLRREAKLLNDPLGYARRQARPVWRKALRAAVWLLVAASVTLGGLWLNPSTRAWVEQVIFQRFEDHDEYRFNGDDPAFQIGIPTDIPEGFQLVSSEADDLWLSIVYRNADGSVIYFDAFSTTTSGNVFIDNEHSDIYDVSIGSLTGTMYEAKAPGGVNFLLWFDETGGVSYSLSSSILPEALVQVAESVEITG